MHRPALLLSLLALSACTSTGGTSDTALDGLDNASDRMASEATRAYESAVDELGSAQISDDARIAVARVVGPEGSSSLASGTVAFVETADGVFVTYDVRGLDPGAHGFHVHEGTSCGPADIDDDGTAEPGGAAGGHFNPENTPHGAPTDPRAQRHAGDLGNVMAGDGRSAVGSMSDEVLSFDGVTGVVGHAMMIHGGRDDLESQPSGAAGARVACGVIELVRGE